MNQMNEMCGQKLAGEGGDHVQLREYQIESRDAILTNWAEGRRKALLVLPTGCG